MNENTNVYINPNVFGNNTPQAKPPKPCPPGHYRSIQAGGHGHYPGDSCGCQDGMGNVPNSSIDMWIPITMAIAILLILLGGIIKILRNKNHNDNSKRS